MRTIRSIVAGQPCETDDRTLRRRHRLQSHARIAGSAHTALDRQSCASGASIQSFSGPSPSSPSNGSLNCTGSLYGASSGSGLGGSNWGAFVVSRSIGQPLSDDAADYALGALDIIDAQRDSVVVPEIELGEVAMQVRRRDVLIGAVDPALQDREVSFDRIGVRIAAHVFISRVVYGLVAGELLADLPINAALVGAKMGGLVDFTFKDGTQVVCIHVRDMAGADAAVAFNQRDDGFLGRRLPVSAVPGFAAHKGLVNFHEHPFAAERAGKSSLHHGLTDAVSNEPSGFEINAKNTGELICAESLLAAAHQVHSLKPNMQRYVAFLKNGADFDGKGLAAGVALVEADPSGLALQGRALADRAAMRAETATLPYDCLDIGVSGGFVFEAGLIENRARHGICPYLSDKEYSL